MFKPKCYVDFNPKDYNLGGKKGCLGTLDYTKKDADGHCGLEKKCVDCKYRRKESSTI